MLNIRYISARLLFFAGYMLHAFRARINATFLQPGSEASSHL